MWQPSTTQSSIKIIFRVLCKYVQIGFLLGDCYFRFEFWIIKVFHKLEVGSMMQILQLLLGADIMTNAW